MTRINFDANGKPHWITVPDTGKFIHKLSDYQVTETLEFSEAELAWFKKPLTERSE